MFLTSHGSAGYFFIRQTFSDSFHKAVEEFVPTPLLSWLDDPIFCLQRSKRFHYLNVDIGSATQRSCHLITVKNRFGKRPDQKEIWMALVFHQKKKKKKKNKHQKKISLSFMCVAVVA